MAFTGSLPRGSHHPGDASRPGLGSFVGVPLGDLVAVPERLRNKGRGTSATSPWRAVLRDPSRLMPSELSRVMIDCGSRCGLACHYDATRNELLRHHQVTASAMREGYPDPCLPLSDRAGAARATPGRRCLASKANRSTALLAVVS